MTRSEAREQAFILLFEKIFNPEQSVEEMKAVAEACGTFSMDAFSERLSTVAVDHTDECDRRIEENLRGWKLSRLPKVTLAILRLALAEILFCDDIPDSVSVNEAVELAKKYGGEEAPKFVNGLLGTVVRSKTPAGNAATPTEPADAPAAEQAADDAAPAEPAEETPAE